MTKETDKLLLEEHAIKERFIRASGPGGQNVNKVATAVELRFNIEKSTLPGPVKDRLFSLAGRHVSADGVLLIDSRTFRTQLQNREAARARLAALIRKASRIPRKRKATKPTGGAREQRLTAKKRRGTVKALRKGADDAE